MIGLLAAQFHRDIVSPYYNNKMKCDTYMARYISLKETHLSSFNGISHGCSVIGS
jgi:hypothetical protein